MIVKLIFLCDLVLVFCLLVKSQQIGDGCIVCKTGKPGIWTKVYSCDHAIKEWNSQGLSFACQIGDRIDGTACCPVEEVDRVSRISEQKCSEYASLVPRQMKLGVVVHGRILEQVFKTICDYTSFLSEEEAGVLEFPHMAVIGYRESLPIGACAGSLISDLYVLAPAHCQEYRGELARYVWLGDSLQQYNIANFTTFPTYVPGENYHDIGLVKLDRKVEFGSAIRPACLPTYFDDPIKHPVATAFSTEVSFTTGSLQVVKATTEKLDYKQCKKYELKLELPNGVNNWTHICVKRQQETSHPNPSSIKGPLQISHHSRFCMYTLIGVNTLARAYYPSVIVEIYTRVAPYMNWIEEIVWPNN